MQVNTIKKFEQSANEQLNLDLLRQLLAARESNFRFSNSDDKVALFDLESIYLGLRVQNICRNSNAIFMS